MSVITLKTQHKYKPEFGKHLVMKILNWSPGRLYTDWSKVNDKESIIQPKNIANML